MNVLDSLLNLTELTVERLELQPDCVHLYVTPVAHHAMCPHCHTTSQDMHQQNYLRELRDLPFSERQCVLHLPSRRWWCDTCQQAFTETLRFVDPYRAYTRRYEASVYDRVRTNTVQAVVDLDGLSFDCIEGIFLREAQRRIPANPFAGLTRLGLDEIAERKGRKAYDLVFYNLDTGKPVEVLQGRTKAQLMEYLKGLPDTVRAGIQEVCIDMWRPYAQAVTAVLDQATLVVDRFHVMHTVTRDLKALKNARKADLPEEAKACHYALLKNHEDLTETQQTTLDAVYAADPRLKRAHQLKEQFRQIFEAAHSAEAARKYVQKWICKAYKEDLFPSVVTAMKTWLSPVVNYFFNRTTNGPSEGVNTKIKLVKRQAYGFRNFSHFRLRILAAFA